MTRIGVIIPSRGDRPQFYMRALELLNRQTVKPTEVKIKLYQSEVCDITEKVRTAFEELKESVDLIFIWEDDDYYPANYLGKIAALWELNGRPHIIGYDSTLYYHIFTQKYAIFNHNRRSSLMSTALSAKGVFEWPKDSEPYLDMHLWRNTNRVTVPGFGVGLKHGIGVCGGAGHKKEWARYDMQDTDYKYLESLMGQDVEYYKQIAGEVDIETIKKCHKPVVSIITRTFNARPKSFEAHKKSRQVLSPEYEQILITDHYARGLHFANSTFSRVDPKGEMVYLLDDDDIFKDDLVAIAKEHRGVDVIFVKMTILNGAFNNTYPSPKVWGGTDMKAGHIGGSCFMVRRELWLKHIAAFSVKRMGDFSFIKSVMADSPKVVWVDRVVAETLRIGRGQPEPKEVKI